MAKTFDIRNKSIKQVQPVVKTEEPAPAEKKQAVPRQSFITRFLDIMLYDILHKFGRGPDLSEERKRWEAYERFERMTRGER